MKNNKILGILLWAIGLIVVHLVSFLIPKNYTSAVWVTYGFALFAFMSQLILWLVIWHKPLEAKERFSFTPGLTLSVAYMILQLVLCIVFALWSAAPVKIVALLNALLLIAALVLTALALIAKNHIERVDNRQKNHHVEL